MITSPKLANLTPEEFGKKMVDWLHKLVSTRPALKQIYNYVWNERVFRRVDDGWLVGINGTNSFFEDRKGFHILHKLLSNPGREFSALELTKSLCGHRGDALGTLNTETSMFSIDERTRRDILVRIEDLERKKDLGSQEAEELRSLKQYLSNNTYRGKIKTSKPDLEKARKSILKLINEAKSCIHGRIPELSPHLETIKTGSFLSYKPKNHIKWRL